VQIERKLAFLEHAKYSPPIRRSTIWLITPGWRRIRTELC